MCYLSFAPLVQALTKRVRFKTDLCKQSPPANKERTETFLYKHQKDRNRPKQHTDCLLYAQLPSSYLQNTSLPISSIPGTRPPPQCPLLPGPGNLHLRGVGVCPRCNRPLSPCLKHILGCHHDIELTCRETAGGLSRQTQSGWAASLPAMPLASPAIHPVLLLIALPPACKLWSVVCTDTAVVSPTPDAGK